MNRVAEVNKKLKELGFSERLRRGRGYYYFAGGEAASWLTSAVYVNWAEALTVERWILEYKELAGK